jgi:AcrR family transcriptional regulator
VAAAAGVAKGALPWYVKSKEALFAAALRDADAAASISAALRQRSSPPGRERDGLGSISVALSTR